MTYLPPSGLGDFESLVNVASHGPYFIPDVYELDLGAMPNFAALGTNPQVVGCILKATDNLNFASKYVSPWFIQNWNRVRQAGGRRYGDSWFRGCYHFGRPNASGADQADYLLSAVDRAGGWGDGDMPPAWDLEGPSWTSTQQIIDISSAFAARIKSRLGVAPILYSGTSIRDNGITNHMGYGKLWTPHLNMTKAGWPKSQYALWQYAGDGGRGWSMGPPDYPLSIPAWGATDFSVVMSGGSPAMTIGAVRSVLTGKGITATQLAIVGGLGVVFALMYRHMRR